MFKFKLLILFFFIFTNNGLSHEKIIFIDMNMILQNSNAGNQIKDILEKKINDDKNTLKEIFNSIKNEEEKLINQKNILSEQDYNEKLAILKVRFNDYQAFAEKKNQEILSFKNELETVFFKKFTQVIQSYAAENKVDLIFDKKNLIIGIKAIDKTNEILELTNNELTSISLN